MDEGSSAPWSQKCACGKRFFQPNSYTHHIQSCKQYKSTVGSSLEKAKIRWGKSNKTKKGKEAIESWFTPDSLDVDHEILVPENPPIAPLPAVPDDPEPEAQELGRGLRISQPTKRYTGQFVATSTMPFHTVPASPSPSPTTPPSSPTGSAQGEPPSPTAQARQSILDGKAWKTTPPNDFGLFKHFWTLEKRPHDPDHYASSADLLDDETADSDEDEQGSDARAQSVTENNPYYPFPNFSSYSLGKWFWNDQEKSTNSFQQLLATLTQEGFKSQDLLRANWTQINASLGFSQFDPSSGDVGTEALWIDDGMSWQTADIELEVPFNSTSSNPGTRTYSIHGSGSALSLL
ncbi:hypothetical protein FA13DRAFT_1795348 [Coprinellus micaceus]|uniref:Uncharacterized protein n=1 Tax=Coprinellus micaceus TaxID=71717 RepID=A0A4Y7SYF1_COPMI|nr:hypothetical protein FA13DRAFT_1795348 [Coprinellus micaceus]